MPPRKYGVARKSCTSCFTDKKKCEPSGEAGAACQRCAALGRDCELAAAAPPKVAIAPPAEAAAPPDIALAVAVSGVPGLAEAAAAFVASGASPCIVHPSALAAPGPMLLLSMAALGASDLDAGRVFASAALKGVLAGLADPLETAQTVVYLLHFFVFRTMSAAVGPLIMTGRATLATLCLDNSGSFSQEMREPATVEEWIRADSALRCWIMFNAFDNGTASYFGSSGLFDAAVFPVPLPAHETYFLSPDPEAAFGALCAAGALGPVRFADFSACSKLPALEAGTAAMKQIVDAIFEQRASCLSVCTVQTFIRGTRSKLRVFSSEHRVYPLTILGKERDEYTADERTYCDALEELYDLTGVFIDAMPEAVGVSLLAGDPLPLMSHPCFADSACAHVFFGMLFTVLATWPEAAADPGEGPSSLPSVDTLFGSSVFLRILDRLQTMCDLLEHLSQSDLPILHPIVSTHAVRVGMFSVVLFRVVKDDPASEWAADRLRKNTEDIARTLAAMATGAPLVAKMAADFMGAARSAGALDDRLAGPSVADAELDEVHAQFAKMGVSEPTSPVAALSEAMNQVDRGVSSWLPSLKLWNLMSASGELMP